MHIMFYLIQDIMMKTHQQVGTFVIKVKLQDGDVPLSLNYRMEKFVVAVFVSAKTNGDNTLMDPTDLIFLNHQMIPTLLLLHEIGLK